MAATAEGILNTVLQFAQVLIGVANLYLADRLNRLQRRPDSRRPSPSPTLPPQQFTALLPIHATSSGTDPSTSDQAKFPPIAYQKHP